MNPRFLTSTTLLTVQILLGASTLMAQKDFEGWIGRFAEKDYHHSLVRVHLVYDRSGVMVNKRLYPNVKVREEAEYLGAIIDRRGLIATYAGDIGIDIQEGQRIGVVVETKDGRNFPARVIGMDHRIDLVLLRVEELKDRPIELSGNLRAKKLHFVRLDTREWDIVTPASTTVQSRMITPEWEMRVSIPRRGKSSPLMRGSFVLDGEGALAGIVTRSTRGRNKKFETYRVLPSQIVRQSVRSIRKAGGNIYAGWLGVQQKVGALHPEIERVLPLSPAKDSGLRPGDRILAMDGLELDNFEDLRMAIRWKGSGTSVTLKLARADNEVEDVLVRLCEKRDKNIWTIELPKVWTDGQVVAEHFKVYKQSVMAPIELGMQLDELSKQLARFLKSPVTKGLWIRGIERGSSAEELGFKVGDVLAEVNGKRIVGYTDMLRVLGDSEARRTTILLYRSGKKVTLQLAFQ